MIKNTEIYIFCDYQKTDEDIENVNTVRKYIRSLEGFKKKQKLHKQRSKPATPCTIIAARDCPRSEIWRNSLYNKYKETRDKDDSFMGGPFFDRFFNLFTLEKFVVTGPASDEFKTFTQENGFVIDYRNSVDGFIR